MATSAGGMSGVSLTPRPQTPPSHLSFTAREVVPLNFRSFKTTITQGKKRPALQCVWSVDGQRLATCGNEHGVRLWNPQQSLLAKDTTLTAGGHTNGCDVTACAWSSFHKDFFCSSSEQDRALVFWDARKKGPAHQLKTPETISRILYAPDGDSIAVQEHGSVIKRLELRMLPRDTHKWDFVPGKLDTVEGIRDFKFNHPGDLLFIATKSGSFATVEYPTLNYLESFKSHTGYCNVLDLDPRGSYMATGGEDGMVNIFNNVEMQLSRATFISDLPIYNLSYSFDGEYLAVGQLSSDVVIASSVSGEVLYRDMRQGGWPSCITWHPSRYIIATCGDHPKGRAAGWIAVNSMPQQS